jgi:hypothetical protein
VHHHCAKLAEQSAAVQKNERSFQQSNSTGDKREDRAYCMAQPGVAGNFTSGRNGKKKRGRIHGDGATAIQGIQSGVRIQTTSPAFLYSEG